MNYNVLERYLSGLLSKTPKLKMVLKRWYQKINYLIYRKSTQIEVFLEDISLNKISVSGKESFFGYYDKSPLNRSNQWVLFHDVDFVNTKSLPKPDNPVNIVGFNLITKQYKKFAVSYAYNWQQGTRLQWLDNDHFIFNNYCSNSDSYCSQLFSVNSDDPLKTLSFPIVDCYNNIALTLSYPRLNILRPDYGYRNHLVECNINNLDGDGVFICDIKKNTQELLISFSKLMAICGTDKIEKVSHKVNHIMINPNGSHFVFLYRFFINNIKHDRLIVSNIDGTQIDCLAKGMISHYCWDSTESLIAYMHGSQGNGYYKLDIRKNLIQRLPSELQVFGDGHPSIYKNKLIFDTYPNKARYKKLYQYDFKQNKLTCLLEAAESLDYYGETRCDFHPRFSMDGSIIFFDSVHENRRHLYFTYLKDK